jgi:hypothetical protein
MIHHDPAVAIHHTGHSRHAPERLGIEPVGGVGEGGEDPLPHRVVA